MVKKGEAVCTGDPENCDACKNDDFGMSLVVLSARNFPRSLVLYSLDSITSRSHSEGW